MLAVIVCLLLAFGMAYGLLRHASVVKVSYEKTTGYTSRFLVRNTGPSEQFVRIVRFVVSTAKFGNLESDQFESRFADAGRSVPSASSTVLTVDAPPDTEEYICSSLRSIGFFAQYGSLKDGRLTPNRQATPLRTAAILNDLSCWFGVSDRDASDTSNGKQLVSVPCNHVTWVSSCVSQVMPADK